MTAFPLNRRKLLTNELVIGKVGTRGVLERIEGQKK